MRSLFQPHSSFGSPLDVKLISMEAINLVLDDHKYYFTCILGLHELSEKAPSLVGACMLCHYVLRHSKLNNCRQHPILSSNIGSTT